jgi:hypothetical protein
MDVSFIECFLHMKLKGILGHLSAVHQLIKMSKSWLAVGGGGR